MIAYGLAELGLTEAALEVGSKIVSTLAANLRADPAGAAKGTAWRECYSSEDGAGLAAPGFLNWNTLAGAIIGDIHSGENPFTLRML